MAITGPVSFVATTQEFLLHWKDVDTFLGVGNALILEGGTTHVQFEAARESLLVLRDTVEDAALERALASATLQMKKEWLLEHLNFLKSKISAVASMSVYARVLPLVPSIQDGQEVFSKPLSQGSKLWKKLNDGAPAGVAVPMVLKDGTTQGQFEAAVKELAELYDGLMQAEQEVSLSLERRNDVQDTLYGMMKRYRVAAVASLPEGVALMDTLPQLTSTSSRTPEAVSLAGQWNAATGQADLTAAPSSDPDLQEYELRACPGPAYDGDLEAVVATVKKGAEPVFHTAKFLPQAGGSASFRVYVVLKSGGQAGSNTVVVKRP